jgi:hypothetical protein
MSRFIPIPELDRRLVPGGRWAVQTAEHPPRSPQMRSAILASMLCLAVVPSDLRAQRTTSAARSQLLTMMVKDQRGPGDSLALFHVGRVSRNGAVEGSVSLDVALLARALGLLKLSDHDRDGIVRDLQRLANDTELDRSKIVDVLRRTNLADNQIEVLMGLILPSAPRSETDFLSGLVAAGSTDRLYSSVDVVRFTTTLKRGVFEARMVSGIAVSVADSAPSPTATPESQTGFRERTASLLTAIREGGPAALQLAYRVDSPWVLGVLELRGAVTGSVASSGKNPASSDGAARFGVSAELHGLLKSGEAVNPTTLLVVARGGYRYAKDGILEGVDSSHLDFQQISVEIRAPFAPMPVGVVLTRVRQEFAPYSRRIQFFGIAGL